MAKVSRATIHLCQITSRSKSDGTYPIVLRVQYNGRAEKYTSVSVPISAWDKKNECVKKSSPGASVFNKVLQELKNQVLTKLCECETLNIPYTAKSLLDDSSKSSIINSNSLVYSDLYQNMCKIRGYRPHTINLYKTSYKLLCEFIGRDDFLVTDLRSVLLEGFARWCVDVKKMRDGAVNTYLARYGSVYRYGIELGIINSVRFPHPYKSFKYWKRYKIDMNRRGLSRDVMVKLESDYINQCCIADGIAGVWSYKDGIVERLLSHHYCDELYIEMLLLMCYKCQGLALSDLLRIRSENITIQKIEDKEYYVITDMHRRKTGELVDCIVIERNDCNSVLMECFVNTMDKRNGYFLPGLDNIDDVDNERKIEYRVAYITQSFNKKVKKIFNRLGMEDIADGITYYTFRHTFASVYMNESGGNVAYLAQMMGRSVNGIFRYVSGLNSVRDIVKEKSKMDI